MSYWSKLQRLTAVAVGCGTGVGAYLYFQRSDGAIVYNSWTTNTIVPLEAKWDFNWDQ